MTKRLKALRYTLNKYGIGVRVEREQGEYVFRGEVTWHCVAMPTFREAQAFVARLVEIYEFRRALLTARAAR